MAFLSLANQPGFPFSPKNFPIFYGWVIVLISVIGILMSIPGQTMGVGVFTDYLMEATGLGRLSLSTAYMFGTILSSFILPFSGKLLDRIGARLLVLLSSMGLGFSLVLMASIQEIIASFLIITGISRQTMVSFVSILIIFLLLRQFGQGVLTMTCRTMMSKWFDRKRGLVTGISGVFISFGFSASPFFLNWIINLSDWRSICFYLAAVIGLGMSLLGWIFSRDNPEECGLTMDGRVVPLSQSSKIKATLLKKTELEFNVQEAKKTFSFWIFNIGLSSYALIVTAFTFHIVSIGAVSGMERSEIFALLFPISIVSVVSNLVGGLLSDRLPLKYLLMVMMTGLMLGTISIVSVDTFWGEVGLITGIGISGGLFNCLMTVTWPRYFGRQHLGAISGFNMASLVFSSAIGPALFGLSYTLTQRYDYAVWGCFLIPLVSLFCALKADQPTKKTATHQPQPGIRNYP